MLATNDFCIFDLLGGLFLTNLLLTQSVPQTEKITQPGFLQNLILASL